MTKKVIKELIFDLPNKEEFFLVHKPFQENVKSVNVYTDSFDDNIIRISINSKFQNKHSPENFVLEYDLYQEHCYLIYEDEYDHSEIIECGRKCASKLEKFVNDFISKEKESTGNLVIENGSFPSFCKFLSFKSRALYCSEFSSLIFYLLISNILKFLIPPGV